MLSRSFFGGTLPISSHDHVTDAMTPSTVTSLILRLAIISVSDSVDSIHDSGSVDRKRLASLLGWSETHLEKWVAVEDSFAAGFGPLVSDPPDALDSDAPTKDVLLTHFSFRPT